MKKLYFILALILGTSVIFFAWNYPFYQRAMNDARQSLTGSETLDTELGKIEYKIQGEGVPVLLLHGAGGGYDQGLWFGKIGLGEGYKFISISRFGFLRSSIPDNPDIKKQAGAYQLLLDHLGINKVIVLGGSAGGPSAMQFANDYPDRVSALIFLSAVSGPPVSTDKDPFYIKIVHLIQKTDYSYWLTTKYLKTTLLGLIGINQSTLEKFTVEQKGLAQEMLDIMHPMSQRYVGTELDSAMILLYKTPEAIRAPALILHAKDDALVSYHHAENAHQKIPGSQLVLFDDGGHGMLSHMDEVRQRTKDFLAGINNR